jgi:hypothetical protein
MDVENAIPIYQTLSISTWIFFQYLAISSALNAVESEQRIV